MKTETFSYFSDFLKTVSEELDERDEYRQKEREAVIKKLTSIFDKRTEFFKFRKISNFTRNSIFFISTRENSENEYVLKIRREYTPFDYKQELEFMEKLYVNDLIPKQIMSMNYQGETVRLEEFVKSDHVREENILDRSNISPLIEGLAKFNSLYTNQFEIGNIKGIPNFFFNFLFDDILPVSTNEFTRFKSSLVSNLDAAEFLKQNEVNLFNIQNFLEQSVELFKILIPSNNTLVFSYIDFHTNNMFLVGNKVRFIDFEDLSFCFLGYDLANYLITSTYSFTKEEYPFFTYGHINNYSEEQLEEIFRKYVDFYNSYSDKQVGYLSKKEIYKLICLTIIKGIIKSIFFLKKDIYLKQSLDFVLLMNKRIETFKKYKSLT